MSSHPSRPGPMPEPAPAAANPQPTQAMQGSPGVIDTPEQSWTDFCSGLQQPAFLLAITGFGDLEQA